MDNADD